MADETPLPDPLSPALTPAEEAIAAAVQADDVAITQVDHQAERTFREKLHALVADAEADASKGWAWLKAELGKL